MPSPLGEPGRGVPIPRKQAVAMIWAAIALFVLVVSFFIFGIGWEDEVISPSHPVKAVAPKTIDQVARQDAAEKEAAQKSEQERLAAERVKEAQDAAWQLDPLRRVFAEWLPLMAIMMVLSIVVSIFMQLTKVWR
jgi:hypothetical protein